MKPAKPMLWVGRPAKPEKAVLLAKAACESKIILEVCGPYTLQGVLGADRETLLDPDTLTPCSKLEPGDSFFDKRPSLPTESN